jgi:voltage-gated potassium channel
MSSFDETQRQLRIALIALCIIFPIGIAGYMIVEDLSLMEAIWITIITLGTIGYGDLVPQTDLGRIFTVILLAFGLGAVAVVAQAAVVIFVNPHVRQARLRRRAERKIRNLQNHYVILGEGQLVDRLISYLLKRAKLRRVHQREALAAPVDARLKRLLGGAQSDILARVRGLLSQFIVFFLVLQHRGETILDVIVVVTQDNAYAQRLQDNDVLVVEDDPTDDRILRRAGILNAQAIMCLLENDTETLLSVLTIRSRTQDVYVTAATHDDELNLKLTRVGANNVLVPYELAGQFMNNMTLRPAVNDYFNSIIFDQKASSQLVQLYLMCFLITATAWKLPSFICKTTLPGSDTNSKNWR